jgi:hypothetical protein
MSLYEEHHNLQEITFSLKDTPYYLNKKYDEGLITLVWYKESKVMVFHVYQVVTRWQVVSKKKVVD